MVLTTQLFAALCLFAAVIQLAACAHDLEEEYRFSASLDDGYKLHWNFDLKQQTIAFAVNVSSTGWVGFGLSPNGQMPQSDVVIGWVDNDGTANFHDRFADGRYLPDVDEIQDWFLINGEEENGYTILEFTRNLTTCDPNDLQIKAETAKVIWAYHSVDPVSIRNLGRLQHEKKGSTSLNLLGGTNEERILNNTRSFTIANENLTIPDKDTTYWCSVYKLPDEVANQEKHIVKYGPVITSSSARYVHHIVVYLCSNLDHTHVGASSECDNANIDISLCRGGGTIFAAWAVGGEDFVYPKDVAYPIGGEGNPQYVILELHYDNPNNDSGISDSSGTIFTYTDEPPKYRAGVLTTGYSVSSGMIIPPGRDDYTITGICPGECTQQFFPPEGITVFGSFLHTHLKGHGLVVRQYRQNDNCSGLEELQPLDENRRYDFNFQQTTHLPREVKVMPGDSIELQCFYRTTATNSATLGGESTREEMCLTFLYYYPQVNLGYCVSQSPSRSYVEFAQQHIQPSLHEAFYSSLRSNNNEGVMTVLDQVEWTEEASTLIEQLLNANFSVYCVDIKNLTNSLLVDAPPLKTDCPYVASDVCTDTTSVGVTSELPVASASPVTTSILILTVCITLAKALIL